MDNAHRLGAGNPQSGGLRAFLKRATPTLLMFLLLAALTGGSLVAITWLDQTFGLSSPPVMRLGATPEGGTRGTEQR